MHWYINIHTHRKPQLRDEFVIRNAFTCDIGRFNTLNYRVSSGIHPWLIELSNVEHKLTQLRQNLQSSSVIALGECGLDRVKGPDIKTQKVVFQRQIALANELKKPLILHLVKSNADLLELTKDIHVPVVIHGFKGNLNEAEQLIKKNIRISIGPRMLQSEQAKELIPRLSLEHVYFETDTKPVLISKMYEDFARIYEIELSELKMQIQKNFERDFLLVLPPL